MHRFRKNKKVKETSDELEKVSSASSSPFSLKTSKKKDDSAESQFELDLSDALPSSDDFRTSLLMPKLSARFSMLREQDDPDTLVGKASDDSVLFPKRASRANVFGNNAGLLTDIDEISSNDGSRPSIALGRADSDASAFDGGHAIDDDRSQSGSMMSRARRTEGNNLFGGRQKVYRIPVRSPAGTEAESTEPNRGLGKFVYEHDLNMSAFQKLRLKEKEEQRLAEQSAQAEAAQQTATLGPEDMGSLPATASGPATEASASTVAMNAVDEAPPAASQPSVDSDTPSSGDTRSPSAMSNPRNGSVRSRRLYGQGLNQTAQNQQSSTLNRLENLSRQRGSPTPDSLPLNRNFSRSAGSLRDRLQKLNTIETTTTPLPVSPPSSTTSIKPPTIPEDATTDHPLPSSTGSGVMPPRIPPSDEVDEKNRLLAAALSPDDHGKATAMGLFNRAATGFDEQQFMRRQLQMHQSHNPAFPPQRPPPMNRALPQEPTSRARGLSKSSHRSRAESASSNYSNGIGRSRASSVEASPGRPGMTTFYANSTASNSTEDVDDRRSYEVSSVTTMTTDAGHSLHQTSTASKPSSPTNEPLETLPEVRYSDLRDLKPIEESQDVKEHVAPAQTDAATPQRPDSPTFGLNGFIRSHLRQVSDQSSIYPPPSPGLTPKESGSTYPSAGGAVSEVSTPATTPDDTLSGLNQSIPASPKASSHHSSEHTANRSSSDSSNTSAAHGSEYMHSNTTHWRDELNYGHRRGASTETQREREEFEIELAERRRKVQEKLRSVAESESRSTSPVPGRQTPDIGGIKAGNAFSILKHKAGKQGMGKPDLKGMMYGNNAGSTPALVSEDQWREEDRPGFNFGRHSNFSSPHVGADRPIRSRGPTVGRTSNEESRESSRSRGPSPHSGFRSRSGSDASGRSKSRTRYRERDDLETVDEAASAPHGTFVIPDNYRPPLVPSSTRASADGESLTYNRSTSAASGRYRSTSRSGASNFQYERPFAYPPTQASAMIGAPPRAPPAAPAYSANATPPLVEEQSPAVNHSATVSSAHSLPQRGPATNLLQKRSVNKKLISEPTLVSSTSNVPLVGLPVSSSTSSASSQQGVTPPPLPPMNPRRRRGTQTILSAFKSDKHDSRAPSPAPSMSDEQSYFPDDEKRPRSRNRLRKSTSETGSLHARARQEAPPVPVPALPQTTPPPIPVNGGMF